MVKSQLYNECNLVLDYTRYKIVRRCRIMKKSADEKLISEFDTIRKNYIIAEQKLKTSYMKKFQKVLDKIADNRAIREINIK